MIWDNDDFFGGMFDFNGDGRTDLIETAIGYQVLDEMAREEGEEQDDALKTVFGLRLLDELDRDCGSGRKPGGR